MQSVRNSTDAVTGAIQGLDAVNEQIGEIVVTVTALAQQTNLLALNAAIEARASGRPGTRVRGPRRGGPQARRVKPGQTAAAEIAALVDKIQTETRRVVTVVAADAHHTQHGAEVAFERISQAVDGVTARVSQLEAAGVADQRRRQRR